MGHEIYEDDHMFSVREKPWHGLGEILENEATAAEAIAAAHLGWQVEKEPLYVAGSQMDGGFVQIPRQYAMVRQDTRRVLGIVGETYSPLQNDKAFKFCDEVTQDPGGPKYVTAGSLRNGLIVWALMKLPSFIEVTSDDIVECYLLLRNIHDGSRRVEMMFTPIRVVCWNTLSLALSGKGRRFKFRHVESNYLLNAGLARDALGIAAQNQLMLTDAIDAMKGKEPTDDECREVLKGLLRPPSAKAGEVKITLQTTALHNEIIHLFREGPANTLPGIKNTGWGFYNAITEKMDHERVVRPTIQTSAQEERLLSNWFGKSADIKAAALEAVVEMCRG